jgi:RND family efflux transporter MFP subunit
MMCNRLRYGVIGMLWLCLLDPLTAAADTQSFHCLIEPGIVIDLGAEVQGVINEVLVNRSDSVTQGQTLVVLNSTVERANLDQALDRVQMDSELNARSADLDLARQVLDRQEDLLQQNLTPQQNVDEARSRFRVAVAAVKHARDNAVLAKHELLRTDAIYQQRFLTSPINGVVIRRYVEPGELVTDSPVLTIAQLDILRVEAVLPASELGRFKVGQEATVIPETDPEKAVRAIVKAIDPMLDAASGTYGIELSIDNADGSIYAGQECELRLDSSAFAG